MGVGVLLLCLLPFVLEPRLEFAFQFVDSLGVDITQGIRLVAASFLRLRDLTKHALEQPVEVIGAECLRDGH